MATLTVGPGKTYATVALAVAAAANGDIIAVDAGTYTDDFITITKRLTIRGVGGLARLAATTQPGNGKAIWVTQADLVIEQLEFTGCTVPTGNGAGVRHEAGNLAAKNCWFHHNQNGVLAGAISGAQMSFTNCEFDHNGAGDGSTHNIYIGDVAFLGISNCYFHDVVGGNEFKSRARRTEISRTRIFDIGGDAAYSVDLPNGGQAVISDCVIEQGPASGNGNIIEIGAEGGIYPLTSLTMTNTTVINHRSGGTLLWNAAAGPATLDGTRVWGSLTMLNGAATVTNTETLSVDPELDLAKPWSAVAQMPLTLSVKRSELAFKVRSGLAILYPFGAPTGTDTGIESTSSFATSPYVDPSNFATHVGTWLTNTVYSLGFDHVRLMVHIGPIIECNVTSQAARKATLLGEIVAAVTLVRDLGLKIYVAPLLNGFPTGYTAAGYLDGVAGTKFLRYKAALQDLANALKGFDPELVALELFHEPPATTDFTGSWTGMVADLHAAARAIMPRHTLIATSAGYSEPDQLTALDPGNYDKNTLWSFHWRPLSSRQGYPFSDETKWFDGADWEDRRDQRAAVLAKVTTRVNADATIAAGAKTTKINAVMATYDLMVTRGRAYVDSQLAAVRSWADNNSVSVICGEYGISGDNASYFGVPEASRLANIRAINLTLAKYGLRRTAKAADAPDFHIPGNSAGVKTLDPLTTAWFYALMPDQGWMRSGGGGVVGSPPPESPPPPPPPTGGTAVDLDFVSGIYANGSLGDLTNTQASTLTAPDSTGAQISFNPNTVRRTDLGVDALGDSARYVYANAMRPANWSIDTLGFSNSAIQTDPGPVSSTWPNARIFKTDNSGYCQSSITESLSVGEIVIVQVAWRAALNSDGTVQAGRAGDGAIIRLAWSGGGEGWYTNNLASATPGYLNGTTFTTTGVNTVLLSSTPCDAQGFSTLTFKYTAQATGLTVTVAPATTATGSKVSIGAVQVVRQAGGAKPWRDTGATTLVESADQLSMRVGSNIYNVMQAASGWVGLEVQGVSFAHLGLTGYTGSTAGYLMRCGSTDTLRPNGTTGFTTNASASVFPVGLSGWRGVVRIALSWNDPNWSLCANGSTVFTGSSGLTHAGVVDLIRSMSCRLRRLTGSTVRPSNAEMQAWTDLQGKTFAQAGTAFVPGNTRQTFYDDFETDSRQTIPSPAFPYPSFESMLDAYYDSADAVARAKKWKPRSHFYTASANGSGLNQINNELQDYLDPQRGNGITTHEWSVTVNGRASYFRGTTGLVSSLNGTQKGFVDANPAYGATDSLSSDQKFDYYSWLLSTAGSNFSTDGWTSSGFAQRFGIWSCRAKFPTGPSPTHLGAWGAFWLYNWADTSELDIQEQYGSSQGIFGGPNILAGTIHSDNFGFNGPAQLVNLGYDLSQDFHDYAVSWVAGRVVFYLDGEQIGVPVTPQGTFDLRPKFMLLNMAVQPHASQPWNAGAPAPDSASRATMPWVTLIDRVTVLQFN